MKIKSIYSIKPIRLSVLLSLSILVCCNSGSVQDLSLSPFVSPQESLEKMEVQEGFKVELVAAEPLLNAPTAMTFDDKGRIWVAEMQNFMLDTVGTGEELPTGKIIILEDKDQDGTFESSKDFMDSLVLPRAIALFADGILIAEPPNLWYVPIQNDLPGKKILVDPEYAIGGNVEHQPNGLLRALDNWIYNAKSDKRYRKKGDEWIIEKTHFRGQWGIAQDNFGRLYYNHNSANVLGDYFSPGFGSGNSNQRNVFGFNEIIVSNNRVYPAHPTPGVNRGYMEGILDSTLRLVNFTAASGLTIYRGDLFSKDYHFNAFVPEPSGNLIKRNILKEDGVAVNGQQAYEGTEFIRSLDERFRPVNLANAPDGALYIVDMYRGIIQHKTYLTSYLKGEIKARKLEQPTAVGRIYRVVPEIGERKTTTFPENAQGLVELLDHSNGWVRDKAQQLIIDKKMLVAVPLLRSNLVNSENPLTVIHSLWTLEGLGELKKEDLTPLFNKSDWHIKVQALTAMSSIINQQNYKDFIPYLEQIINQKDELVAPSIAFTIDKFEGFDKQVANQLAEKLIKAFPKNKFVADAIISGLQNEEASFLKEIESKGVDSSNTINKRLHKVLSDIEKAKADVNTKTATENYPQGAFIYNSTCSTCHGKGGYGIEALAPLLNKSDWVLGEKDKVIATVLYGLTGPIVVNKNTTHFAADMPGIGQNPEFSDKDIAQIVSYIRSAWSNNASSVNEQDVIKIREKFKGRKGAFIQKEIDAIWKQ